MSNSIAKPTTTQRAADGCCFHVSKVQNSICAYAEHECFRVIKLYNYSAQFPCLLAIRNQVSVFMVCLRYELYVNTDYTLINHFTKCQVEPHFATFVSGFYKHFSKIWVIPTRQHHSCFRFVEHDLNLQFQWLWRPFECRSDRTSHNNQAGCGI